MQSLDTTELRDLVRRTGPFASVYLDVTHDTEDAAAQLELRRRAVRTELLELGASEETAGAVDAAIESHEPAVGRAALAVIGAEGSVLLTELLPEPPPAPVVRVGQLPYLLPLVEQARSCVPYVVAVVDRTGADVRAVDARGATVAQDQVHGSEHQVHEVGGGGWSHRSIRSRVEENVKHNLDEVAAQVGRLAAKVNARAVMVAGEIQARTGLLAALPEPASRVAVELVGGSRAAGADEQRLREEIDRVLAEICADDEQILIEAYGGHLGVQGLGPVAAALREGNAEVVLLNPAELTDRTMWVSPEEPSRLAATAGDLRELGWDDSAELPALEVLPVAAVAVGAELRIVDAVQPADGVGVLLRYRPGKTG